MRFLFPALLVFISLSVSGQSNIKLWEKLYNLRNKSFTIINHSEYKNPFKDSLINEINLSPAISNNNVYCWIAGTGRLYQLIVSNETNALGFKRIDSTHHSGNNYDALLFDYNHNLYSLGGYGFWRKNGQLKVFDTVSNDWQIVPVNKEIPVSHSNTSHPIWYDPIQGKVYLFGYSLMNEAEKLNASKNDVMQLDLKTRNWKKIGILNEDYIELIEDGLEHSINKFPLTVISLPWGVLVRIGANGYYLLDVANNELKLLEDNKRFSTELLIEKYSSQFYADSTYYAYDAVSENLDSLTITEKDFKSTGIKIYKPQNIILLQYATGSIIILSLISFLMFIWKRKNKSKRITIPKNKEILVNDQTILNNDFLKLDNSEINILELMLLNGKQNQYTSIEELNKVLGLTKKNINIQKKQRSDLIISLNRKLTFLTQQKDEIILKKRNLLDKRSFDYYIDPKFLDIMMKFYVSRQDFKIS